MFWIKEAKTCYRLHLTPCNPARNIRKKKLHEQMFLEKGFISSHGAPTFKFHSNSVLSLL